MHVAARRTPRAERRTADQSVLSPFVFSFVMRAMICTCSSAVTKAAGRVTEGLSCSMWWPFIARTTLDI